jgi:heat shock protein HslJ
MAEQVYEETGAVDALLGRTFVSASVAEHGEPRPLVPGTQIRLAFSPGHLGARAGCNTFGFPLTVEADRLVTGDPLSTLMGCTPERQAQDRWLAGFLGGGPSWSEQDGRLTLTVGHTSIVLDEQAELWGLTFTSVSVSETGIVPAPVVEGTTITLTFIAPDRLSAQAGCNTLGFHVVVDEAQLTVADEVRSTRMACTDDLMAQDSWLSAFLTDDPVYDFTAGTLTLTRGSTEIVFAAEAAS